MTSGGNLGPYNRATIIAAARVVGDLGHTDLDDLLLEWGLPDLVADRTLGSRAQRGVAIGSYAVARPEEVTADGVPVPMALVRRAVTECIKWLNSKVPGAEADRRRALIALLPDAERAILTDPIKLSLPDFEDHPAPAVRGMPTAVEARPAMTKRVFLVHGRNDAAKNEVTLFLERLGLEVVILHEQANGGRTLLAKFIEEASSASFAVVLMTSDDVGRLATDTNKPPRPRARQNVVFELGFFVGLIGPEKVCALVDPEVERPSDFEPVVYIPFGLEARWKQDLARELRAAKLPINTDALLR